MCDLSGAGARRLASPNRGSGQSDSRRARSPPIMCVCCGTQHARLRTPIAPGYRACMRFREIGFTQSRGIRFREHVEPSTPRVCSLVCSSGGRSGFDLRRDCEGRAELPRATRCCRWTERGHHIDCVSAAWHSLHQRLWLEGKAGETQASLPTRWRRRSLANSSTDAPSSIRSTCAHFGDVLRSLTLELIRQQ